MFSPKPCSIKLNRCNRKFWLALTFTALTIASLSSAQTLSTMTFPTNGATNVPTINNTFTWTSVADAQVYYLYVGSAVGLKDVFNSGELSTTSIGITSLSANKTYYIRLWTKISGHWNNYYVDSTFTTGAGGGTGLATLTSPLNGATNVDPFTPFTWTSVSNAQGYYVYIGSTPGGKDVENSGVIPTSQTSLIPQGLIGGQTYYVMMFTEIGGKWSSLNTSFTTATQSAPANPTTYWQNVESIVDSVRMMTIGITNTPIAGTPLAQVTAADGRTTALCTEYARTLEQQLLAQRISARIRHSVFDGTNTESHTFNEYYDLVLNKWVLADSDFGAVYLNPGASTGLGLADLSAYVVAHNWSAISSSIVYVSSYGDEVFTQYYMDPILLFLNPLPTAVGSVTLPLANSPTPFLTAGTVGTGNNFVFTFVNQSESVTLSDPEKGTIVLTPLGGTIYSVDTTLHSGWSITSSPTGLGIFNIERVLF